MQDVEALGRKMGFTTDRQNFHNVSLGQGQEVVAEEAMEVAAKAGHWVVLQVSHRRGDACHVTRDLECYNQ